MFFFFFFKQKTAYEIVSGDWSSDVCSSDLWREISSVSSLALFAMLGIECAMVPASRVRDPERTIPRATLAGTLTTAAIYIAISAVPMFVIPQAELAVSNSPYADLFEIGRAHV